MKENVNFYENIDEARLRLRNTIVCYDGEPYKVIALANHHKDGIIRIYMRAIAAPWDRSNWPSELMDSMHVENDAFGPALDKWLDSKEGQKTDIIRKMMNSPKFNKYRPFPLGMCNYSKGCIYLERQPNRKVEQGLIQSMVVQTAVSVDAASRDSLRPYNIDIGTPEFRNCVVGNYPTASKCLENLKDPEIVNNAAAFHREFALVRGPMNMLFLGYRDEIIGVLPNSDFSTVRLGVEFGYTKEAVADLRLFSDIQTAAK